LSREACKANQKEAMAYLVLGSNGRANPDEMERYDDARAILRLCACRTLGRQLKMLQTMPSPLCLQKRRAVGRVGAEAAVARWLRGRGGNCPGRRQVMRLGPFLFQSNHVHHWLAPTFVWVSTIMHLCAYLPSPSSTTASVPGLCLGFSVEGLGVFPSSTTASVSGQCLFETPSAFACSTPRMRTTEWIRNDTKRCTTQEWLDRGQHQLL
jgi:hypothetical protein